MDHQPWVLCMQNIIIMGDYNHHEVYFLLFEFLSLKHLNIEDHQHKFQAANESAIFQTPRSSQNDLLAFGFVDRRRRRSGR